MSELKIEAVPVAFNYDPNIHWAKQRVRVTLGQWDYRTVIETTVGGNCKGFEIFDSAVCNAWESLLTRKIFEDEYAYVELTRANGDTLLCEDDMLDGEDWLKELVIGIEIVAIEEQRDDE
jgi:hypothetical protein